jgi:hypothetical protein
MKIHTLPLFLLLFMVSDEINKLDDLKWKNRVVLYFPAQGKQEIFDVDSLTDEFKERKLAYFVFNDSVKSNIEFSFSGAYTSALKKQYQLGSKNECWVLIGLDGGVKVRKESAINWQEIFGYIDAMPMRQSEFWMK